MRELEVCNAGIGPCAEFWHRCRWFLHEIPGLPWWAVTDVDGVPCLLMPAGLSFCRREGIIARAAIRVYTEAWGMEAAAERTRSLIRVGGRVLGWCGAVALALWQVWQACPL